MRTRNRFWWFVALALCVTAATFLTLGIVFWQDLSAFERAHLLAIVRDHPTFFFMGLILIIAAVGFALDGALNSVILPLNRMIEEVRIILSANPSHRLRVDGSRTVQHLADLINLMAGRIEVINDQVAAQVAAARQESHREKTILAALVGELPQGVVVCNTDHRIILYNRQAKRLLTGDGTDPDAAGTTEMDSGPFLGLGRSIKDVVDSALIRFATHDILRRSARNDARAAAHFVIPGCGGRLIQAEMVPVLGGDQDFDGYILMLEDVTERMALRYRMSTLLMQLITKTRSCLAGIRSAIEIIVGSPDMDADRRKRLSAIIYDESVSLSAILDASAAGLPEATPSSWPLMPVRLDDLFSALARRSADEAIGCRVDLPPAQDTLWIMADSYLLLAAMGFVVERAATHDAIIRFVVRGRIEGRFIHVDLLWQGAPMSMDRLQNWQDAPVQTADSRLPMTLGEAIQRHDGALLPCPPGGGDDPSGGTGIRMLLPMMAPPSGQPGRGAAVIVGSRPEFYDFDLFNQAGQLPQIDSQPLEALTYTVFDTETTGLDPRGGDEIISLGAVRIVNQRVLREECFDQLVDPRRPIPWGSVKYHGIHPDMVAGKPTVDRVLAHFHRFAADTVLVAHNAAFDMRMLQVKEAATGIYFINPVLDTMLLSTVVHPDHADHCLEAIAERLGVTVEGRHTALGDAVTTAEVFLKLIALLRHQGIRSLMEARRASEKSYYARLSY